MNDKNSGLINVDLQPVASVLNNVIDKFANAVGWGVVPRGSKKDMETAIETYIKEIQEDTTLPPLIKGVKIANARKEIKEYINLQAILQHAQMFETEYENNNEVLDEDWAMFFYDKAKNTSDENIRLIFGKLLAQECNNKGSASKSLINTVSLMDNDLAKSFSKLCKCVIYTKNSNGKENIEVLIPTIENMREHNIPVSFNDIVNLTSIGLIEYAQLGGYVDFCDKIKIRYGTTEFEVTSPSDNIPLGRVNFTKTGKELAQILIPETDETYLIEIKKYYNDNGLKIV